MPHGEMRSSWRGVDPLAASGQSDERLALLRQLRAESLQGCRSVNRLVSDRLCQENELDLLGDELLAHLDLLEREPDLFVPGHWRETLNWLRCSVAVGTKLDREG